jgi:hypothetical protein
VKVNRGGRLLAQRDPGDPVRAPHGQWFGQEFTECDKIYTKVLVRFSDLSNKGSPKRIEKPTHEVMGNPFCRIFMLSANKACTERVPIPIFSKIDTMIFLRTFIEIL